MTSTDVESKLSTKVSQLLDGGRFGSRESCGSEITSCTAFDTAVTLDRSSSALGFCPLQSVFGEEALSGIKKSSRTLHWKMKQGGTVCYTYR
ncbi:uncharacterized [Tachysurus ichikawai]